MAPVQQQLLPKPAEDPEIQHLTDELLDLSIATDESDEDAEHLMMELDGDSSEETEDAREPPMESSLERVEREKSIQHTPTAAFKIVGDSIDKKV